MKRHLPLFLVILFVVAFLLPAAFQVQAQATDLPFLEDFEGYDDHEDFAENSGWTLIDANEDGFNWFLHYDDYDDIHVMASRSYDSDEGALTPENYLVTPLLKLPVPDDGNPIILSYHVAASGNNFYEEKYKVIVSATGNDAGDFDDEHIVFEEVLTEDESGWGFALREVDLSDYAGEEVYIAFVHYDCENQDRLIINNVAVEEQMPAGQELPFADDFEGYDDHDDFAENSGWTLIDADGDGFNWFLHYDSFDDIHVMASRSYDSDEGALTPENYLITPRLKLPELSSEESILLEYDVAASGENFYDETYKVVVSTAGNAVEDFVDEHIVLEETITEDESYWSFALREIDLSDYAGQEIFIAFVHFDSENQDRLLINNVSVEKHGEIEHDLPFAENFEAYENTEGFFANSGWTAIDADGDGENWYLEVGELMNVMASASWDGEALTPENWLITPEIQLPGNPAEGYILLAYDIAATGANFYEENYKVVVSTEGNEADDFSDEHIVWEETLTEAESGRNYARRHIDLEDYAGESIHIAFVHYDCENQDRLVLNNVKVAWVNSATVYPEVLTFNPLDPEDVSTTVTWYGATEVTALQYGEDELEEGVDYIVESMDEASATLTILQDYFEGAEEGDMVFDVGFDSGDDVQLTVNIGAAATAAVVEPAMADYDPELDEDVVVDITWNDASEVTAIQVGEETLDADHYQVENDQLIIFSEYFSEMDPGYLVFDIEFDLGDNALLVVRVFDHTVRELVFEEDFMGMEEFGPETPEAWLPNGWRSVDADGDGFNWYYVPVTEDGAVVYGRMQSRSSYQDEDGDYVALTPDNWLISPPIELDNITAEGQEIELTFRVGPGASTPAFRQEHFSVMVSYTDLDPESFDEVYAETISEDHPQNELQERSVELSYYEGQTVYVAFRHHDVEDMDRLLLTGIKIEMHGEDDTRTIEPDLISMEAYPNPARERLNIRADAPIQEVMLIGMQGNVVYHGQPDSADYVMNLQGLSEGTYILRATTAEGVVVQRIQVVR